MRVNGPKLDFCRRQARRAIKIWRKTAACAGSDWNMSRFKSIHEIFDYTRERWIWDYFIVSHARKNTKQQYIVNPFLALISHFC
jgi:hypothetical protein